MSNIIGIIFMSLMVGFILSTLATFIFLITYFGSEGWIKFKESKYYPIILLYRDKTKQKILETSYYLVERFPVLGKIACQLSLIWWVIRRIRVKIYLEEK